MSDPITFYVNNVSGGTPINGMVTYLRLQGKTIQAPLACGSQFGHARTRSSYDDRFRFMGRGRASERIGTRLHHYPGRT